MHLAHRGAAQAAVELLAVEVAHVDRGEGLELDTPQGRDDVRVGHVLVRLVGALADRAPYGILEPPLDVLPDRKASVLEDQSAIPVRHRPRELCRASSRVLPVT